ncbi:TIGR03032 family protein [Fimbriiglobus ruber]|uniref:Conserved hypothetical protein CHP03032 domain-containing protein n=1 Tax=Fimbriiglobus ruber TaxID=1908690 RepID=A0A225D6H1_9BACT|nr:TIGR03032 family protein [Fimbriiglobus ruber]OWK35244.1 hypothetical protein FRUB_09405 [Fimbriiglobus ruber]
MIDAPRPPQRDGDWIDVLCSPDFPDWLARHRVSLGFTTYQSGKLFLLGRQSDGRLDVRERTFDRCMGLWAAPDARTLWLATRFQLWRFTDALQPGAIHDGHDRLYVPRTGHTTADLDAHDVVVEAGGRVVFVNTKFGCLATLSDHNSFTPLWQPTWLSRLAPEDRCHLNGLALEGGRVAYVTAVGTTDVADGWRDRRRDGGILVDVRIDKVVAGGLSMPHSPRVGPDDRPWLLNSGTGYLGVVDVRAGWFEPVAFCPGYARGLAFVGGYAVVGLSKPRHDRTFGGLALGDELARRGADAWCGLVVVDLATGEVAHWVRVEGMVTELYDVVVLAETVRPTLLGFKSDDVARLISIGEPKAL